MNVEAKIGFASSCSIIFERKKKGKGRKQSRYEMKKKRECIYPRLSLTVLGVAVRVRQNSKTAFLHDNEFVKSLMISIIVGLGLYRFIFVHICIRYRTCL